MEHIYYAIPIVMFAGMVRGFSGFGFAVIAVVGLNFFFDPKESVLIVLALDLTCSVSLWKQAFSQAEFATLKKLVLGSILGIPIGYAVLLAIPADILKLLICITILALSLLLFSNFNPFNADKTHTKISFGMASGAGTASASIGGPMIVYYMLSSELSTSTQRATMILFFIVSEVLTVITLVAGGLVNDTVTHGFLILLLPTLLAVRYGQYLFNKKPPQSLKSFALPIMLAVAILGIIKASITLMA